MNKLHLGRMTFKELGEWRGVNEKTLIGQFKRYGKELEEYCKFTRYKENGKYAGIDIEEIYEDEYLSKNMKRDNLLKEVGLQIIKDEEFEFYKDQERYSGVFLNGRYAALAFIHKYPEYKYQCSIERYARLINEIIKQEYPEYDPKHPQKKSSIKKLGVKPMLSEYYLEGDEKWEKEYQAGKPRLMTAEEFENFKEICVDQDEELKYWTAVITANLSEGKRGKTAASEIQSAAYRNKLKKFRDKTGLIIVAGRVYQTKTGDYIFIEDEENGDR